MPTFRTLIAVAALSVVVTGNPTTSSAAQASSTSASSGRIMHAGTPHSPATTQAKLKRKPAANLPTRSVKGVVKGFAVPVSTMVFGSLAPSASVYTTRVKLPAGAFTADLTATGTCSTLRVQ